MAEPATLIQCPLCEGEGALSPSAIVEQFSNPELRKRLNARIAEIAANCTPVGVGAGSRELDFQTEAHNWNRAVPVWRRSPKE
jgi:hypothetical protein